MRSGCGIFLKSCWALARSKREGGRTFEHSHIRRMQLLDFKQNLSIFRFLPPDIHDFRNRRYEEMMSFYHRFCNLLVAFDHRENKDYQHKHAY